MDQSLGRSSTMDTIDGKVNIDIIRKQEYLFQLKSQAKFPLFEKLKKFAKLNSDEEFKHHTKVKIIVKEEENEEIESETTPTFIFVFADKIIFTHDWIEKIDNPNNLTPIPNGSPVIQVIDYAHFCVFNLVVNETKPNRMSITYYDQSFNSKAQINFKFIFLKDSYCVHHFIKKYYVLLWQKLFESTILADLKKLIYNKHFTLIKYNRWKKKQERILLITNAFIFNLDHNLAKDQLDFKAKKIKWADPILAIKTIVVDAQKGKELQLRMSAVFTKSVSIEFLNNDKYIKFKPTRDFEFFSTEERNEFISLLRKNFYDLKYLAKNVAEKDLYLPVEVTSAIKTQGEEASTK